jgi:hypothetical protein
MLTQAQAGGQGGPHKTLQPPSLSQASVSYSVLRQTVTIYEWLLATTQLTAPPLPLHSVFEASSEQSSPLRFAIIFTFAFPIAALV